MTIVSKSTKLNASAGDVWNVIGDFNGLPNWLPPVAASVLEDNGTLRHLTLGDGGEVFERLVTLDKPGMRCTYAITDSPLPIENYSATLSVADNGDGTSTVTWESAFAPTVAEAEAQGIIEGIYQAGFDALKQRFGG